MFYIIKGKFVFGLVLCCLRALGLSKKIQCHV